MLTYELLIALSLLNAGPRIDLNQNTDRGDVISPAMANWKVADGPASTFRAGEMTLELRAVDPAVPLTTAWWKPGFDYPAAMASDGVVCRGALRLVIRGLPAGQHSLGSWHSALTGDRPQPITIAAGSKSTTVTPSQQARHDDEAAGAYIEFDVRASEDVIVEFTPTPQGQVVINGFEIDHPDPMRRALQPTPADNDEHAPENPVLTWQPAKGATAHHVYLGTDAK